MDKSFQSIFELPYIYTLDKCGLQIKAATSRYPKIPNPISTLPRSSFGCSIVFTHFKPMKLLFVLYSRVNRKLQKFSPPPFPSDEERMKEIL